MDGVLEELTDFVSCPTFYLMGLADHKLVRFSLQLANRPSQYDIRDS